MSPRDPQQIEQRLSLSRALSTVVASVGIVGIALSVLAPIDELIGFTGEGEFIIAYWKALTAEFWKNLLIPLPDAMLPSLTVSVFVLTLAVAGRGLTFLRVNRRSPDWLNPFIILMAVVAFAHFIAGRRHATFTVDDRIQGYFFLLGLTPSGLSYLILPYPRLYLLLWIAIIATAGLAVAAHANLWL